MSLLKKLIGMAGVLALASPLALAQTAPATTTTTTPATAATPATPVKKRPMGIEARQRRQQRRIAQGVKSGELTPKETKKLERQEAGIERREQKMRASGGKFTKGERKAVQKQLNKESKQIYKEKHDKDKQQ